MAENSKIEWCHHTFNPWLGCTKLSLACDFCYAEGWAKRTGQAHLWQGERRRTSEANWRQPRKWNAAAEATGERHRVFCASLADVFDNQVPLAWREDLWRLIDATPHLDWMLLTKRPQNIARMLPTAAIHVPPWGALGWPNVWLGTTAENQAEADRRITALLQVPARIRFLSCEPLLGPIDLSRFLWVGDEGGVEYAGSRRQSIHLVIAGGESGPGARVWPGFEDAARAIRDRCASAGTAFFMKQMAGPVKARMSAIPPDLMIRQMPETRLEEIASRPTQSEP